MSVEDRLRQLNITLPTPVSPLASYVPFVITGSLIFISGQISSDQNGLIKGVVGSQLSIEQGNYAARCCGLNLIAQLKVALNGDLDRVQRIIKLTGFVLSVADFDQQPKVINGASDLMIEVFGDIGRHARVAVGTNALPLGVAVEVDLIAQIN